VSISGRLVRLEVSAFPALESSEGGDMATKIFVNLPVKSLDKSVRFFTNLGYTFDPQFTDETGGVR
jgi:hypothetical protein